MLDGNGETGGKCFDKGQSTKLCQSLDLHEKIHTLLALECPGRAVLSALGFIEPPLHCRTVLLSEFCASGGDVNDPGGSLCLLLLLS